MSLNKVFLRPDTNNVPTDYHRSLEKSGLVVVPQVNLALWTCKTGPNQGPQGIQGEPGVPYLNDCIISSCSDEYSPLVVDLVTPAVTFPAPYPLETAYIRFRVVTAPTGADIIVDVHINDTSIFQGSNYLHIDAGSKTSVGSVTPYTLAFTAVPDDAEIKGFIRQVGSTVAGTGLKCVFAGAKQDTA